MPVSRVLPPHGNALVSLPVAFAGLVTQAAALAADGSDPVPQGNFPPDRDGARAGQSDASSLLTVAAATGASSTASYSGGDIDLDTISFDGLQSVMDTLAPDDCPSKARVGCRWRVLSLVRSAPASSLNADGTPIPASITPTRRSAPSPAPTMRASLDQRKVQNSTAVDMISVSTAGARFSSPVSVTLEEESDVSLSVAGIVRHRQTLPAGTHQLRVDPWLPDGEHEVELTTEGLRRGKRTDLQRVALHTADDPPSSKPDQLARYSMPQLVPVKASVSASPRVPVQEVLLLAELDASRVQLSRNGNNLNLAFHGAVRPHSAVTLALRAQYRGQPLTVQIGDVLMRPTDDLTADPDLYRYLNQIGAMATEADPIAHFRFPLRIAASADVHDTAIAPYALRAGSLRRLRDWSLAPGAEMVALSARWSDSDAGEAGSLIIEAAPGRPDRSVQPAGRDIRQRGRVLTAELAGNDHAGYHATLSEQQADWPMAPHAQASNNGDAVNSRMQMAEWRCEPAPMLSLGSPDRIDVCLDSDDDALPMTMAAAALAMRTDLVRDSSGIDALLG